MPLTCINVAYPLAPVGPDAVGGAEQVLHLIDRDLVEHGDRSIVIACHGSRTVGELVPLSAPSGPLTPRVRATAAEELRLRLTHLLAHTTVDLVHFHGHDFATYLPPVGVPALATIHLPPELLTTQLEHITREGTWANGVSTAHQRRLPQVEFLLPPIENGVDVDELWRPVTRRQFAIAIGRVCPEKGFHLALDAARMARTPLLLAGGVFPYEEHLLYLERDVRPRLASTRRFIGPVSMTRKRRLLNAAKCLLIPSQLPETSSLVAMEALACGTPVIAFPVGALPDIIRHGATGFIVNDVDAMAEAIARIDQIDREACRAEARERFSARRMLREYRERYADILQWSGRSA